MGKERPILFTPANVRAILESWASRITLEITDVRVDRVQEISEENAEAEGITDTDALIGQISNPFRTAYAGLWDSINGKNHPWSSNPFVWAISFKAVRP